MDQKTFMNSFSFLENLIRSALIQFSAPNTSVRLLSQLPGNNYVTYSIPVLIKFEGCDRIPQYIYEKSIHPLAPWFH